MPKPTDDAVSLSDAPGVGVLVTLSPDHLVIANERIPLHAVTHVAPVAEPSRVATRRWVQFGSACVALLAGLWALQIGVSASSALITALLVILTGVLASDWMEARFPTPGRYSVEVALRDRAVRIDGLASPDAAQLLHERIAFAVRRAQGLNG